MLDLLDLCINLRCWRLPRFSVRLRAGPLGYDWRWTHTSSICLGQCCRRRDWPTRSKCSSELTRSLAMCAPSSRRSTKWERKRYSGQPLLDILGGIRRQETCHRSPGRRFRRSDGPASGMFPVLPIAWRRAHAVLPGQ